MRRIAVPVMLGLVAACGGAADEQAPVQPLPPPTAAPPSPADTTPAPVATAPPAPPPKPSLAEMETAAVADIAANFTDSVKLAAHYAPDAILRIPGVPPARGRQDIQAALQGFLDQNTNVARANVRSWTKGNVVAVHWVTTGTNKATAKPWGVDGVSIDTFNEDGLLMKEDSYFDLVTMMKQTGAYKGETAGRPVAALPTGALEAHVSKGDAAEDANVAGASALNAAWSKLDDKTALALYADTCVFTDFTDDQTRDKKYTKEIWLAAKKALKDVTWKDWSLFGVQDFTIDEGEFSFTQSGDFVHGKVRIPNKKKTVTGHNVEIDQWKDGKIVKSWNWSNEMEMDTQLGIGPAADKPAPKPPPPAKKDAAAAKTTTK